ncbi:hypothetical protein [Fodinibius halophilus]|uniref:Uncharacterized protein n=1 Tax=Fodinibius halophilus TaxID=1736908 RepID=A0A6M1T6R0_9BACT|nr:hypothetical protein [Fodinibius halophilus]NGP88985.1 hypothetical protein [Fodinibius halophilus]
MSVDKTIGEIIGDFVDSNEDLWETEYDLNPESGDIGQDQFDIDTIIQDFGKLEDLVKESVPHFAGVNESWDTVKTFDARVIEINDPNVVLDCLIDRENKRFETRIFRLELFNNFEKLREGQYILIRQFTKPGKVSFTINDGEKLVNKEYFESHPELSEIDEIENQEIDLSKL